LGALLSAQDIIKISFMALKCFVCGLWVAFYLGCCCCCWVNPTSLSLSLATSLARTIYATFGQSKLRIKKSQLCAAFDDEVLKIMRSHENLLSARVEFIRQNFAVYELLPWTLIMWHQRVNL